MQFRFRSIRGLIDDTIRWNSFARLGEHDFSGEALILQDSCLEEEVKELFNAINDRDEVEVVDALMDILFVASYAEFLDKDGVYKSSGVRFDVGCLSPRTELSLWSFLSGQYATLNTLMDSGCYSDMVDVILYCLVVLDIDEWGAYKEVVDSNYSKFPLTSDINLVDELRWFNKESKYDDVCVEEFDGRFVFRCNGGDGKIVKPRCFREPQLEPFIRGNNNG